MVNVCDAENVTCCGFRELVRFLKESSDQLSKITYKAEEIIFLAEWDLSLHDWTTLGQGWFGPTQLTRYRNQASYSPNYNDSRLLYRLLSVIFEHFQI